MTDLERAATPMNEPIRVLHVDDEPAFAEMVADFLDRETTQFTIGTATSASEGRDQLAGEDFDCIVSDYEMPGQNGIEFLETVREEYPDLPFILYTGKGSEEVASDAISAGVTDYLQKETGTSQYEVLAHRIRNAVESHRSRKEIERTRIKKTELEAKYRSITEDVLNATAVGTIILDADFRVVWCSRAIAEFFGIDRSTLTGTDKRESLRGEVATVMERPDRFADTLLETYENDSYTGRLECHVLEGDGRAERWLEYRSHPIETGLFEGGRVEIYTEVTDRVERERELERTERRYRALLEHAHDAIARVEFEDETPVIREATPEFESLFEPPGEDVIGQDIDEVVASEEGFERAREISLRTKEGESIRGEATRDTVDGPRDFIWQAVPIQDPETGEFDGGFAIYTDITEQQDRERALKRKNERLDAFASAVSHDLRTPLEVAGGRIDLAREECNSRHLRDAADSVDRALALIDDLLALAREGDSIREITPGGLSDLIEECWGNVQTADATLRGEIDRAIHADPSRLQRLLENLFQNAVDHGGDDATVSIGELEEGFYIADDGSGISEADHDRIFETGYTTAEGGTGFGLDIVRRVVEAHDWDITVTESDDGGARFEISGVDIVHD